MFIKTADGSYINANQVQSFTIEEDTRDGTFFISVNLNAELDDAYWLADFDTKDKAQKVLDDLINTINRGSMNITLPPNSTFYAECKRLEEH